MLLYLYPIGDEAVMNYIRVGANTPDDATWRAGCPVDIFKKGEWTHLVSTWDATAVRLYANGQRVAEGLVSSPLPKLTTGTFTICPVDFWKNAQWGDRDEQTVCDEVRVFDHALTDEEVLDLYAADIPGGLAALEPKLVLDLKPDYFANAISATVRPAHLSDEWRARIAKGAAVSLTVRDPAGTVLLTRTGKLDDGRITVPHLLKQAGLVDSTSEAMRMIQQGAVKLDGDRVNDKAAIVESGRVVVAQVGKRKFARISVD